MEKLMERQKNDKIKGLISHVWLILYINHKVQPLYLMFVPNFKILGQVVPEKPLTKISIFIT